MKNKPKDYDERLMAIAQRAMHGLDESAVFVGVLGDKPLNATRIEFLIQLAHCILMNKTIIVPAPHGYPIPPKLEAIADRIVR